MSHVPHCRGAWSPEGLGRIGAPTRDAVLVGDSLQRWGAPSGHPVVGPWRRGVTSLTPTAGSGWRVSLSAGAPNKLGVGDTRHVSQSPAGRAGIRAPTRRQQDPAVIPGQDSPHGAQAAAVQLQLAEVGQVHPWGPQEGEVRD